MGSLTGSLEGSNVGIPKGALLGVQIKESNFDIVYSYKYTSPVPGTMSSSYPSASP